MFMRALSASGRQYSEHLRATCCRGPSASRMERQRPARASRAPALGDLSFRDSSSLMPLESSQWSHFLRRVATRTHDCTAGMWRELLMLRLIIDGGLSCVCVWQLRTVCFFVLCKRHRLNRVPGAHHDGGKGGGWRSQQCYGHGRCPSLLFGWAGDTDVD